MEKKSTMRDSQDSANTTPFRFVANAPRRAAKRRSSVACLECRRRKVRCDIIKEKPQFCTNCRLNEVLCEIKQHKKGRKEIATISPPMTPMPECVAQQVLQATNIAMIGSEQQWDSLDNDCRTGLSRSHLHRPDPSRLDTGFPPSHTLPRDFCLPSFIKPLSTSLRAEEWQYLSAKGCFAFPPLPLQKIIVDRFMEYVYPLLPVVYIDDYVTIGTGKPLKSVSLTLYHALLGAGLAAVNDEIILQYGYSSKAAARDEFYSNARALLEVNAETGRLVTCQVALLLVGWSTNNDPKDGFYWSGIAINQAFSMSLHKQISTASTRGQNGLFIKRLWWTIVTLEADVCLTTGRPPRLTIPDTPDFQIYDSTINEPNRDYHGLPELERISKDPNLRHLIQTTCVEKAKLSQIILRLMTHLHGVNYSSKSSLEVQSAWTWQFDAILHDWEHNLPLELRCLSRSPNTANLPRDVQLTVSMVILTYLAALIMLHKPEVPVKAWDVATKESTLQRSTEDQTCQYQAHAMAMRRAADGITEIYTILFQKEMSNVIPGMGIPTLCAAIGVHLLDARSTRDTVRTKSFEKLQICLMVLRDVGKLNSTAKEIAKLVESAVSEIRLSSSGGEEVIDAQPRLQQQLQQQQQQYRQFHHPTQQNPVSADDQLISNNNQLPRENNRLVADLPQQGGAYSPSWMDPFLQMESFFNFEIEENLWLE